MNLMSLSNEYIIENFENCVRNERKVTAQIIEYVGEIDRRKLYLEKGYSSLFDYLTKSMGYSPGAAMRRIDAARLLRDVPVVTEKIKQGTITLSQTTQIQRAFREYKKIKNVSLAKAEKHDLLMTIENTNQKETEKIIATVLELPPVATQKEQIHRDSSVTLTITLSAKYDLIHATSQLLFAKLSFMKMRHALLSIKTVAPVKINVFCRLIISKIGPKEVITPSIIFKSSAAYTTALSTLNHDKTNCSDGTRTSPKMDYLSLLSLPFSRKGLPKINNFRYL